MKKAQDEWEKKKQEKKAQPKPVYLKDYQRKVLLEDGGIIDEEAELPKKPLTYVEEQQLLKEALSKANIVGLFVHKSGFLSLIELNSVSSLRRILMPRMMTRSSFLTG